MLLVVSALILGFIGSFHCVAMCGAISLSLRSGTTRGIWKGQGAYHLGRISMYVMLALLFSAIHAVGYVNQGQNIVSLVVGSLLFLVSIALLFDLGPTQRLTALSNAFLARFRSVLLRGKAQPGVLNSYAVGFVNGLLPCGFVYLALASALSQESVGDSMLFMLFFGLGTVPSLLGLVIVSLVPKFRPIVNSTRFLSAATAVAGLLLVIRGMALGIPYLSPQLPGTVQTLSDIRHEQVCGSPHR